MPKFIYDPEKEVDDEDKEMTPLAKRHNEIVRERYPEDEVEEDETPSNNEL